MDDPADRPVDPADVATDIARLLRARGERMTRPRRAVVAALAARPGHSAAEDVVTAVGGMDLTVHRSSVYRTLDALTELGVVQHVHVSHGGTAYHLLGADSPHLPAQCHDCGLVYDLPADLLDAVADRLSRDQRFVLDAGHIALSGACANCSGGPVV